jgi:hypothetical protein
MVPMYCGRAIMEKQPDVYIGLVPEMGEPGSGPDLSFLSYFVCLAPDLALISVAEEVI